jgi:hypothetical protein
MNYTPEVIKELKPNEVFVFGSNEAGIHGAGAARLAKDKFGAIIGKGFGLWGQSFAIPTKDKDIRTLPLDIIERYIYAFFEFADMHPELTFYFTKIGCGWAGYKIEDIAPIVKSVPDKLSNVILPIEFSN